MGIVNLTRAALPKLSKISKVNIESVNSMPEMVLNKMIRNGQKGIVHVDMNRCTAARITEQGINTIYTDGLAGCNSVGLVAKGLDGKPIAMLSHYVPTNVSGQISALEKQLATYDYYLDKSYKPKLFFNIRGENTSNGFTATQNPIIEKVKEVMSKFFPKGSDISIEPYLTQSTEPFFSRANIFQFDPANLNKLKITNVGEKEKFLDLMM